MKILMISAIFPYPPTRGGTQVRTFNLLQYLNLYHDITLVTLQSDDITPSEIETLNSWVKQLIIFPRPRGRRATLWGKLIRFLNFLQSGTPPNVTSMYSLEMQQWLDNAVAGGEFSVITCEHSVNEIYIRPDWQKKVKTVANIHSSVYLTCRDQLLTGISENPRRDRIYAPFLKNYERLSSQKFTTLVVTTPEDKKSIEDLTSHREISVVPNGVNLSLFPYRDEDSGGHHLILTGGMDYSVNIDSACFFVLEIFPMLQQKYADVTLTIVGSNPAAPVLALAHYPGVTVTGRVPSMIEYLHRASVCIVPMRSGFGIKNKTLEAMAAGVPVVGSDRGLEGLTVDGLDVPLSALRANKVDEYVAAISRLFEDSNLRIAIARNARDLIENNYTWPIAGAQYEKVLTGTI
ncbi:MAG: glycosyltransferase [Chlorogloea purpurea SAG 13.99]|nr:glycosyltransferase [Chlorogloea purpurea SAG 13.99]